jgi:molybdate transport system substrate-binding protein
MSLQKQTIKREITMNKKIAFFCLFSIHTLFYVATFNKAQADIRGLPNITILASSSLATPITELSRKYSRLYNITVTASYNSSSEQAWRIEEGESADIFISSHHHWMSSLKQMGLIDVYSLANLVRNKLVLVSSTKGKLSEYPIIGNNVTEKLEYLNNRTIMSFGDPDNTSLGMYTKQALINLGKITKTDLWTKLDSTTIKSASAKNNLYLISHGETAGIIYYSDAANNEEIRILSVIDESLHDPIVYQAAVVAGENMEHAREFLNFLQTQESKQIFKKHGFIID